jgi:hypothetical protein
MVDVFIADRRIISAGRAHPVNFRIAAGDSRELSRRAMHVDEAKKRAGHSVSAACQSSLGASENLPDTFSPENSPTGLTAACISIGCHHRVRLFLVRTTKGKRVIGAGLGPARYAVVMPVSGPCCSCCKLGLWLFGRHRCRRAIRAAFRPRARWKGRYRGRELRRPGGMRCCRTGLPTRSSRISDPVFNGFALRSAVRDGRNCVDRMRRDSGRGRLALAPTHAHVSPGHEKQNGVDVRTIRLARAFPGSSFVHNTRCAIKMGAMVRRSARRS